jgi:prophage antirepressor-like protein
VGKDVANILGYENGSRDINRHVDVEDRQNYRNGTSEINNRGITIINESGLYSLILSSKLPKAKAFKHWVTSEVLPTIRQTGGYIQNNAMDFMIQTVVTQTTAAIMAQIPAIVSETVKTTLNLISNESGSAAAMKPGAETAKKRRISYHGKIDNLPVELRNEIITMVFQKNYTLMNVSNELEEKGHKMSLATISRYLRRLVDDVDALPGIEIET